MTAPTPSTTAAAYDATATQYTDAWAQESAIPHTRLENELVARMLGACAGARVLDIGGGSGGHARRALAAGAAHVDVIDISEGMMRAGREIEQGLGREKIGWHVGDAYRGFAEQGLQLGEYDVVLAVWVFDHAAGMQDVEALWRNIAGALKDGGRVVGVRVASPWAESARTGKYGSRFFDLERVDGGVRYKYEIATEPVMVLEASSMEVSYGGATDLPNGLGVGDMQVVEWDSLDTIKADREFWEQFTMDPHFVGFTGRKGEASK